MGQFEMLNDRQKEAVLHTEGPLLVLAGAGSGKTRVLTHRIAYLIEEKGVNPWHILAITFTNKAAGEMRERVERMLEAGSDGVWVSTFHSMCVRILRRWADRIGYGTNFTIYDADDQKSLIKDICKQLQIDTKTLREKAILDAISSAKDELVSPEEYEKLTFPDYRGRKIAAAYKEYQAQLLKNNAMDFDDLINKTVELLADCPEALDHYQNRFRYIMVDEYQDTNTAQFRLVGLLAKKNRNLCVVGDDDQSIYKFRGANIHNILDFEKTFPDAAVIRLEQNYRSTKNILDAANSVIRNNVGRKKKTLWTDQEPGEPIAVRQFMSAHDEAEYVAMDIQRCMGESGIGYGDTAVLYRTNAQSRLFEEQFLHRNIPYRIVGGVNFYARKEIKDLLAYLKTIDNAKDDLAVRRILNVPRRGIGTATVAKVQTYAMERGIGFYQALECANDIPGIGKAAKKLGEFVTFIRTLRAQAEFVGVRELLETVIESTGYVRDLQLEGTDEAESRIENVDELISKAASYEETTKEPSLSEFLEEVALVADIDSVGESESCVLLMTLHSAKGLEFPNVYLTGMEEGVFPSHVGYDEDPDAIEEERRLCYVGITRAMRRLTLSWARSRMIRGETRNNRMSRFLREVPQRLISSGGGGTFGGSSAGRKTQTREMPPRQTSPFETQAFEMPEFAASPHEVPSRQTSPFETRAFEMPEFAASPHETRSRQTSPFETQAFETLPFAASPHETSPRGTPYLQAKKAFRAKAFAQQGQARTVKKADHLDYGVGDRVRHAKFGVGTVETIRDGGRDYEVTVRFGGGVKKMFAAFAKLEKV